MPWRLHLNYRILKWAEHSGIPLDCMLLQIVWYIWYVVWYAPCRLTVIWLGPTEDCEAIWLKLLVLDFSGGSVVKNLPAHEGDAGSIPAPWRSHKPGTTKPVCTTTEPTSGNYWSPRAQSPRSGTREATTRQLESSQSPLPATREKSMQATKNYHNQK